MAETQVSSLPLSTLLHLLTIKLSTSNFLLWRNQILPLLSYQKLLGHVDGSLVSPSPTIVVDEKESPNPAFLSWREDDQRALIILQSSLSEEAMAEALNLTTAREVWLALERAYRHDSVERMQNLRDSLRQLQKGTMTVSNYGRQFKSICDQLAAIGHPVDDLDKSHWFLCGLGPSFETFSTAQRAINPRLPFVIYFLKLKVTNSSSNLCMAPPPLRLRLLQNSPVGPPNLLDENFS